MNVTPAVGISNNIQVFKGLFFTANISSRFSGGTYIWTKGEEQLPGSIADNHFRLLPMPDVVKFNCNNTTFAKQYSVYTTNSYEAEEILTPDMLQHIIDFQKKVNRKMVFSFVAGMCYVGIPFKENLLDSKEDYPDNKEEIKEYFFTVLLILSIINKLELYRLQ